MPTPVPSPGPQGLLRRIVTHSPIIAATYCASSVVLGFGFANPMFDVLGLAATGGGYMATERGMARWLGTDGLT